MRKRASFAGWTVACLALACAGCGNKNESQSGTNGSGPQPETLGGLDFSCGNSQQGSQQQMQSQQTPYQKSPSCSPTQQNPSQQQPKYQFPQSKATDFEIHLSCDQKQISIRDKKPGGQTQTLPIQDDGSVQGQMQTVQQVTSNDGRAAQVCWIGYVVQFKGKASCNPTQQQPSPSPMPEPSASPSPEPSSGPGQNPAQQQGSLQLNTQLTFRQANLDEVQRTSTNGPASSGSVTISILSGARSQGDQAFGENPKAITAGSTVTWVNQDTMEHTVTSDTGAFDSRVLLPGQSFQHTFAEPGDFAYHCSIHPTMKGRITVVPSGTGGGDLPGGGNGGGTTEPGPQPSVTPVQICVIQQDPCPYENQVQMSCPQ